MFRCPHYSDREICLFFPSSSGIISTVVVGDDDYSNDNNVDYTLLITSRVRGQSLYLRKFPGNARSSESRYDVAKWTVLSLRQRK